MGSVPPENGRLADSFGRRVRTLRISLTDDCNFRCVYCMPPEGLPSLDHSRFLGLDEIVRFARIAVQLGVERIRLTGGEPTLRKDVVDIVRALAGVDGLRELSMTTNGSRLVKLAGPLREAGLDRINVSLDSLDPGRFASVTRVARYEAVRDGIEAAIRVGFPVKINVVVLNGISEEEILEFAALAGRHDLDVRFLEFMPLCGSGWQADLVYPIARVREVVRSRYTLVELPRGDRPAQTFAIAGGRGRVGFIAPLSEPFCDECSRIRLTADGKIRPCLFSDYELSLGGKLGNGASDEEIAGVIRTAVWNKPRGSEFAERPFQDGKDESRVATPAPFIRSIGG